MNDKIKNVKLMFVPIWIYFITWLITSGPMLDILHGNLIILVWLLVRYKHIWDKNEKLQLTYNQICIYLVIFLLKQYITRYALIPIAQFLSNQSYDEFNANFMSQNNIWFSAVIVAPIIEEWLFRGISQCAMEKCFKNAYVAIVLQALLFGAWHHNWYQFLSATLGGMFYGYLYHKHKNLKLCIAVHSLHNLIAF